MKIGTCKQVYMALRRAWWYGMFFSIGFNMLIQDWMGLEGYIVFLREHWVDVHWVVGLSITAFALYAWIGLLIRHSWLLEGKEKEDGNIDKRPKKT